MKQFNLLLFSILFISTAAFAVPVISGITVTESRCSNTGSATVIASGTPAIFGYQLISGPSTTGVQSSGVFSSLAPGTYTVLVSDIAGGATQQSFTITGSYTSLSAGSPVVNTTYNCSTGLPPAALPVTILASGGRTPYTYTVNGAASPATFNGLQGSSQSITITDSCGNVRSITYTVPAINTTFNNNPATASSYRSQTCTTATYQVNSPSVTQDFFAISPADPYQVEIDTNNDGIADIFLNGASPATDLVTLPKGAAWNYRLVYACGNKTTWKAGSTNLPPTPSAPFISNITGPIPYQTGPCNFFSSFNVPFSTGSALVNPFITVTQPAGSAVTFTSGVAGSNVVGSYIRIENMQVPGTYTFVVADACNPALKDSVTFIVPPACTGPGSPTYYALGVTSNAAAVYNVCDGTNLVDSVIYTVTPPCTGSTRISLIIPGLPGLYVTVNQLAGPPMPGYPANVPASVFDCSESITITLPTDGNAYKFEFVTNGHRDTLFFLPKVNDPKYVLTASEKLRDTLLINDPILSNAMHFSIKNGSSCNYSLNFMTLQYSGPVADPIHPGRSLHFVLGGADIGTTGAYSMSRDSLGRVGPDLGFAAGYTVSDAGLPLYFYTGAAPAHPITAPDGRRYFLVYKFYGTVETFPPAIYPNVNIAYGTCNNYKPDTLLISDGISLINKVTLYSCSPSTVTIQAEVFSNAPAGTTYTITAGPGAPIGPQTSNVFANVPFTASASWTISVSDGCGNTEVRNVSYVAPPIIGYHLSSSYACLGGNMVITIDSVTGAAYKIIRPNGTTVSLHELAITNFTTADIGTYQLISTLPGLGCSTDTQRVNIAGIDCAALPVKLISFNAATLYCQVNTAWKFDAAELPKSITVQSSTNGSVYNDIATLPGTATSYTDLTPDPQKRYYRIRYADMTGKNMYSWIVAVSGTDCSGRAGMAIYPNPASDWLTITISGTRADAKGTFMLYDMVGKRVLAGNITGTYTQVDVSHLAPGMYAMQVKYGNINSMQKIMVK